MELVIGRVVKAHGIAGEAAPEASAEAEKPEAPAEGGEQSEPVTES